MHAAKRAIKAIDVLLLTTILLYHKGESCANWRKFAQLGVLQNALNHLPVRGL